MVRAFVPRLAPQPETSLRAEASGFFRSVPVWLTLVASAGGFAGMFAVYSYIARIVTDVAHLPESDTPWYVLAYGLGMVVGTWLAGELTHWSVFGTLVLGTGGSALALLAFWWGAPVPWLLLLMSFTVSVLTSLLAIGFQLRLMEAAHGAENLGAAMNHASLNVANALGAWMGGAVIAAGYGYRAPALVGAAAALFGLVMVLVAIAHASRNRFAAPARV
jgi:DHA1 family inner membrane transport protein